MKLRVVDAARELFEQGGERAVTLRAVAERIEYAPATLYLHFQNKEALLQEMRASETLALIKALRQAERARDPRERLHSIAMAYVDYGLRRPAHFRTLFFSPTLSAASTKESSGNVAAPGATGEEQGVEPSLDGIYEVFHSAVFKALAAGCFKPEHRDAHEVAQALWQAAHGAVALHLAQTARSGAANPAAHPGSPAAAEFLVESLLTGLT